MSAADRERLTDHETSGLFADDRHITDIAQCLRRTQGLGDLAQSLRELRATLELRFITEEAPDGFFDMIRDRGAVHLTRVEEFRREHTALIRDTERVLDRVRACVAGPVAEIRTEARILADRIERHEARERDLLGDAMSTDAGAGDEG